MRSETDTVVLRPEGLYCPAGDFHIDPWRPVARAVITHAHADHARTGSAAYLASEASRHVLRERLGDVSLQTLGWGESLRIGAARVSLHPAGHVLGAAQIRIETASGTWVVSGDYRMHADRSCTPFEPVLCDTFVTESTFGLPVYRWPDPAAEIGRLREWWAANAAAGQPSRLHAYSLGKAQRILAALADLGTDIGPIVCHPAVERINAAYRATGIGLPETAVAEALSPADRRHTLLIVPPAAAEGPLSRRFRGARDAVASGWMRIRGVRRRRAVDRGFVISDHADWPGLNEAIAASGAGRVVVTHGYEAVMIRWLRDLGLEASGFATAYGREDDADISPHGESPPPGDPGTATQTADEAGDGRSRADDVGSHRSDPAG